MKAIFGKGNFVPWRRGTKIFYPHSFKPEVEFLGNDFPWIITSNLAYEKMWHYVDIADEEISWLGSVEEIETSGQSDYFIKDVFLLRQENGAASTEITEQGLVDLVQELLKLPNGNKLYQEIRFWGHSHVNMETQPSSQDERQMELFEQSGHQFFIRAILNKRGKISFTLYRYDCGIKITDVPWGLDVSFDTDLRMQIEKEFAEKVQETRQVVQIGGIGEPEHNDEFSAAEKVFLPHIFPRKEKNNGTIKAIGDFFSGKAQKQTD